MESMVARNSQLESLFMHWGLEYNLIEEFPIADIKESGFQQNREVGHIASPAAVAEYYEQLKAGAEFPPIVLRAAANTLVDGNTRIAAFKKAGRTTIAAYSVRFESPDFAKAIGAAINQLGGNRLTPAETYRAAIHMMESDIKFTDADIARALGRQSHQVKIWRLEQEVEERAKKMDLPIEAPRTQYRDLGKVTLDRPFKEFVELTSSRRLPNAEVKRIAEEIVAAPSEEAAVEVITQADLEFPVHGSRRNVVINTKVRRMRMVLPQVLKLAPADEIFDPERAVEDEKMWRRVLEVANNAIAMYDQMLVK